MLKNRKRILYSFLALILSCCIGVLILASIEISLRFKYDEFGRKFFCSFDPALLNHITIFPRSFPPAPKDLAPRVFCLGGSTTNGCSVPIPASYPNLLQTLFEYNKKNGTVYNFGVAGVGSVTTNFFIKNIVSYYKPQCIIIHDGYNDLPVVIKKTKENNFLYITPNYYESFNPYIRNPVLRYLRSFIRYNFFAARRFLVEKILPKKNDVYLGFDYMRYKEKEGNEADIFEENSKRLKIMIEKELDTIDYCLRNGIKVIVILEPHIKPMYFERGKESGFRDPFVGFILSECHKIQQAAFSLILYQKYSDNKNVAVIDMREAFKDRYDELFYDECHMNWKGNALKAAIVYDYLEKLFPGTSLKN